VQTDGSSRCTENCQLICKSRVTCNIMLCIRSINLWLRQFPSQRLHSNDYRREFYSERIN
jgi:hypothetical protein